MDLWANAAARQAGEKFMSWLGYSAIFIAFFVTHSIPVRPAIKTRISGVLGARGFTLAYSVLSIAMLALLIRSAGEAPFVELWSQMPWQRHVTHLGMLGVCLILALSIGRPNPFSFGGARDHQYTSTQPGITRWTRHPILLSLALWAGAHLLSNGDLAHVLLFGVLGGFSLTGHRLIDRRKKRNLGKEQWVELNVARAQASWIQSPKNLVMFCVRLFLGVCLFIALLWTHIFFIGISAF